MDSVLNIKKLMALTFGTDNLVQAQASRKVGIEWALGFGKHDDHRIQ
jgi:hypothetical protein